MVCPTWTYFPVDAKAFASLKKEALKQGFTIPDKPNGVFRLLVAGMHLEFAFNWNHANKTLRLTCTKKPFIVSCATIKNYADKIITGSTRAKAI